MLYDTVIIGAGAAGYTAAIYAARSGMSAVIIENKAPGGQMAISEKIENYPGFPEGINGAELAAAFQRSSESFGVKTIFTDTEGFDLNERIKRIKTAMGDFVSKTVILATGAKSARLGIEREDFFIGRGLSYCAVCDAMFYKNKTTVVIGGGNSALSSALFLADLCKKVIVVHRRNEFRAEKAYIDALNERKNIEVIFDCVPEELLGVDRIENIVLLNNITAKRKTIKCDGIFVCIGYSPNTDMLPDCISKDSAGYINASENTHTNIDGVYAAGDLRSKPLRQIVTAVCDGAVAASQAKKYIEGMKGKWE